MEEIDHKRLVYDLFLDIPINDLNSYKQFLVFYDVLETFEKKLESDELKKEFHNVLNEHTLYYSERKEELVEFALNFVKKFYLWTKNVKNYFYANFCTCAHFGNIAYLGRAVIVFLKLAILFDYFKVFDVIFTKMPKKVW